MTDTLRYLDVAKIAARKAGEFIRSEWDRPRAVRTKADESLVTAIDTGSETLIRSVLGRHTPECAILGEEEGLSGERDRGGQARWYVDPVDGTTNLAHGFPWISVSIALVRGNEPLVGVVYHPIFDLMFAASAGGGATLNGKPLLVSRTQRLDRSMLATGFVVGEERRREFDNVSLFQRVLQSCYGVRRAGSAALDLAAVAAGWFDGYWEIGLKPWDTAAGWLLVREAGGQVTGLEGQAFDPNVAELIASNGVVHQQLVELLAASRKSAVET